MIINAEALGLTITELRNQGYPAISIFECNALRKAGIIIDDDVIVVDNSREGASVDELKRLKTEYNITSVYNIYYKPKFVKEQE